MRSALCDDQRTTDPGRAAERGAGQSGERERGESGDNTCDVRGHPGQYGGIMWPTVTKWVSQSLGGK